MQLIFLTAFFVYTLAANEDSILKTTSEKLRKSDKLVEDVIQSIPTTYEFKYSTGNEGPAQLFREEYRDNDGSVRGKYGYVDPHGKLRVIKYTAGAKGYSASGDIGPDIDTQNEAQISHRSDPSVRAQADAWSRVRSNNLGPNYNFNSPPIGWSSVDPLWNVGALPQQPVSQTPPQPQVGQQRPPVRPSAQTPSVDKDRVFEERLQNSWDRNTNPNNWQKSQRRSNTVDWNTWDPNQQSWSKQNSYAGARQWTSNIQHQWQKAQTGNRQGRGQWGQQQPPQSPPTGQWPQQPQSPPTGQWPQQPQSPPTGQWPQQPQSPPTGQWSQQPPPQAPAADSWSPPSSGPTAGQWSPLPENPTSGQWTQFRDNPTPDQWSQTGPQVQPSGQFPPSQTPTGAQQPTAGQPDLNELKQKWTGISSANEGQPTGTQWDGETGGQSPAQPTASQWPQQPTADRRSGESTPSEWGQRAPKQQRDQWAQSGLAAPRAPGAVSWQKTIQHDSNPAQPQQQWPQSPATTGRIGSDQNQPPIPPFPEQPQANWGNPSQPPQTQYPSQPPQLQPASADQANQWPTPVQPNPVQYGPQPTGANQANQWPSAPAGPTGANQANQWQSAPAGPTGANQANQWQSAPAGPTGANQANQWPTAPAGPTSDLFSGAPFVHFRIDHSVDPNQPPLRYQYSY